MNSDDTSPVDPNLGNNQGIVTVVKQACKFIQVIQLPLAFIS